MDSWFEPRISTDDAFTAPHRIWTRKSIFLAFLILPLLFISARNADSSDTKDRALVLGGGGPVGEAWESGVIAGLTEKGIDLTHADLIVGTSAGAIVGTRLASRMPCSDFVNAALAPSDGPRLVNVAIKC